ncbi:MAG: SHOCT domain-containing protein [Planctomycetaceae bacterium]
MGGQGAPPFGGPGMGGDMDWGTVTHAAHPWWGVFGVVLPTLVLLALIGVVIWAVLRVSRQPAAVPTAPFAPRPDGALEALRLRYARGEIDRAAFLSVTADLGGPPPAPSPSTEPPEPTPEAP